MVALATMELYGLYNLCAFDLTGLYGPYNLIA